MSPDEPALRLMRAMVFAVVCLAVSVGGHALAGGVAVAPGIAALAFGGLLALAYLLSCRERGPEIVLGGTITAPHSCTSSSPGRCRGPILRSSTAISAWAWC